MTRLLFAGLILLTLSFIHGEAIFRIFKNRQDDISLLIFSLVGALAVQLTFLMTIEKSNAATATVLQFLSPTIIVAWFALVRKSRPGVLVLAAIGTSLLGTFLLIIHGDPTSLPIVGWSMLLGGAMLLPFYARQGGDFVITGNVLLAFLYLVIIGTSLTFSLYLKGAQLIGGPKASILSCTEPLSSTFLSLLYCWELRLRFQTGWGHS